MSSTKTRVLVIGGSGFLGSSLITLFDPELFSVDSADREAIDLGKSFSASFQERVCTNAYRYIVISAAITDVERCFRERERSNRINVTGTRELLDLIRKTGATPVFFSSDYVFEPGPLPHQEEAPRKPETLYGLQKLEIERYIESHFERFLIFRTSKLMSKTAHSKNILLPLIRELSASRPVRCFSDQWVNPVFVEDVSRVVQAAFSRGLHGIFHLGTRRVFTRAELGGLLAKALGRDPELIEPMRMSDFPFSEKRPSHNTLECTKIEKALDFRFCELEDAVPDLRRLAIHPGL